MCDEILNYEISDEINKELNNNQAVAVIDYYKKDDSYVRSNCFISSKYKSSLLSNKLMAICLSKIDTAIEEPGGSLILSIKGSEIQDMLGVKGNNFFYQLDKVSRSMTGRSIGWSNPETKEFEYISVVTMATFKNNIFTIEFNRYMKKYLKNIKMKFTSFSLKTMLSFKSTYSFRLYELLKSESYYSRGDNDKSNKFEVNFNLNELKLSLGVVNAELEKVQNILRNSKGEPDYDKAVESSPEKVFTSWSEFKRNCIDVAVNEINELESTNMHVEYIPLRSGKGGKVYAINFYVQILTKKSSSFENTKTDKPNNIIDLSSENKDMIILKVLKLISGISYDDAKNICEVANYDYEKINDKYNLKTGDVENIVGWMISAINKDYKSNNVFISNINKEKFNDNNKRNSFHNFNEREYDYEELFKNLW